MASANIFERVDVHWLHPELVQRRVRIAVAGVGGNGAQVLSALARLDLALRALGHKGVYVTAFDADAVSEANIGRQVWSPSDIGINKAIVAVRRINLFYGFDWMAVPAQYDPKLVSHECIDCDMLISCVDTKASRRYFHQLIVKRQGPRHYWLDLGNEESTGQVVLGEIRFDNKRGVVSPRLPVVTELFPELLNKDAKENNTHSCSLRISLQSQGLYINDFVSRCAMQLLYRLFSRGMTVYHGVMINIDSMRTNPIPINPAVWERYGCRQDGRLDAVEKTKLSRQ